MELFFWLLYLKKTNTKINENIHQENYCYILRFVIGIFLSFRRGNFSKPNKIFRGQVK